MKISVIFPLLLSTFLGLVFFSPHKVHSWGPIAHYIITKEALGSEGVTVAPYANLPDAWPSQTGLLAWLDTGVYFRWSHGVIDHGHYNAYIGTVWLPKKPTFPDDGRYPGQIMKKLIEHKINNSIGKWGNIEKLRLVQKGFRAHNAADRIVHWEFFLGAIDVMTTSEKIEAWTVHHGLKETWAEYLILADQYPSKTIIFHSDGFIVPPQTCLSLGIPNLSGNINAMAKLLRLAQRVHRKNRIRHFESGNDEDYQFTPQTESEIAALIQAADTNLSTHFNKTNWAKWEAVNVNFLSDYLRDNGDGTTTTVSFDTPRTLQDEFELLLQAREKFENETAFLTHRQNIGFIWNKNDLASRFNSSKTKVQEWVNK